MGNKRELQDCDVCCGGDGIFSALGLRQREVEPSRTFI